MVWILGSPRTGSTWLLNLLAFDRRVIKLDEPTIGVHLGALMLDFVSVQPRSVTPERLRLNDVRAELPHYFFSRRYEEVWRPLVRQLLLGRFDAEVRDIASRRRIPEPIPVIKEPVGSQAADILMSLLPEARLLFLLRDGRDVIDSELDAFRPGGWVAQHLPDYTTSDRDRLNFVNARAHAWLARTEAVERAYADHGPELRMMVRYEDLLADTQPVLSRLVGWLGLELDEEASRTAVAVTDFDRLDDTQKGPGKFARAARPGLWRENLTADEQELIEGVMGAKLRELGY